MEYGLIFHGTRTGKYYCKNMKYRISNSYTMGSRGISEEMPVSRGRSPSARAFIPIFPVSNHGITILYLH